MTYNWIFDSFYIAASMNDAPYEECIRQAAGNNMNEGYYTIEYKCPTFSLIHKDLSTYSKLRRSNGYSIGNLILNDGYYVIDEMAYGGIYGRTEGLPGLAKPSVENQVIVNDDVCTEIKVCN